jgi:cytochrome c peroxidase
MINVPASLERVRAKGTSLTHILCIKNSQNLAITLWPSRIRLEFGKSDLPTPDGQKMRSFITVAILCGASALRVTPNIDRRTVFRAVAAFTGASTLHGLEPAFAEAPDYAGAKKALQAMIAADKDIGPTMVRLAWHSSGTYDKMSKTGGSGGGTIRFKEELAHGGNAGLDKLVAKLEPVHKSFPTVSYADLYTLAGATALEAAGVPVPWKAGRVDAMTPAAVTPDGRLPAASKGNDPQKTAKALRMDVFYRMGFNDKEIVALSGAHALGRCHPDASGYSGPWTPTPYTLNNGYFNLLLSVPWTIKEWNGPMQFEDPSGKLMMLPSDLALVQDKNFRPFVQMYAKDNAMFVKDFTAAYTKLTELGTKNLKAVALA